MAKSCRPWDVEQRWLNFTDPQSKIMRTSDGFIQGYDCQVAVDGAAQIIIAHEVVAQGNDASRLPPMLDQIRRNTGRNPVELSADNGYCSEANLAELRRRRVRAYVATGRERSSRKRTRPTGPLTIAMRRRLKRAGFRSRYRLRKQIVEPVFGHIKAARQLSRFSLRGLHAVDAEWAMLCTAHNLLKLFRA